MKKKKFNKLSRIKKKINTYTTMIGLDLVMTNMKEARGGARGGAT